jgi:hypothetical protein
MTWIGGEASMDLTLSVAMASGQPRPGPKSVAVGSTTCIRRDHGRGFGKLRIAVSTRCEAARGGVCTSPARCAREGERITEIAGELDALGGIAEPQPATA